MAIKYKDLTLDQKLYLFNGLGSEQLGIHPPAFCFSPAAVRHDAMYLIGGTEKDRWAADWMFFLKCLELIWQNKVFWQTPFAVLYYVVLVMGGWLAFEYRTEPIETWLELKTIHDLLAIKKSTKWYQIFRPKKWLNSVEDLVGL